MCLCRDARSQQAAEPRSPEASIPARLQTGRSGQAAAARSPEDCGLEGKLWGQVLRPLLLRYTSWAPRDRAVLLGPRHQGRAPW